MLSETEFKELSIKIAEMLDGLVVSSEIIKNGNDHFELTKKVGSTIADSIAEAFSPLKCFVMGSCIIFYNEIDATHVLATPEGQQKAHATIFDNLVPLVRDESGRLGRCLKSVAESSGRSIEAIREMIDNRISEFKNNFISKKTYAEKNSVLLALREFYDEIRDSSRLENFVSQNSTSYRPK